MHTCKGTHRHEHQGKLALSPSQRNQKGHRPHPWLRFRGPLNVFHNGLGQTDSAAYDHTLETSWWVKGTVVSLSGSTSW